MILAMKSQHLGELGNTLKNENPRTLLQQHAIYSIGRINEVHQGVGPE